MLQVEHIYLVEIRDQSQQVIALTSVNEVFCRNTVKPSSLA